MSINLTVSYALFLRYFLHRISCRHTIHVVSLMHLANLINAVRNTWWRGVKGEPATGTATGVSVSRCTTWAKEQEGDPLPRSRK